MFLNLIHGCRVWNKLSPAALRPPCTMSSLRAFSTSTTRAFGSSTHKQATRVAPVLRPASTASIVQQHARCSALQGLTGRKVSTTVCMAEQGTGANLDRSTPDSTWKKLLSAQEFHILREKGTEPPGSGQYNKHYEKGVYKCAGCGSPLYKSDTKFNSGCGWPAFYDNLPDTVERHEDRTFGMTRIEITCKNCGGHLGHVFKGEGFPTPTDERHCVNSVSIKFEPGQ